MDPNMLPLPTPRLPLTLQPVRHKPFVRLRYVSGTHQEERISETTSVAGGEGDAPVGRTRKQRVAAWARQHGLESVLAPFRPYELYAPGDVRHDLMEIARAAGFSYALSKSGFGQPPQVLTLRDDFLAINYTVGHWDGWTPFETINRLDDLRTAERRLLAAGKPGWLLGTLDSCLWAFTGPIWQRGAELYRMAEFLANGGASGQLINATPRTIARYARHVARRKRNA
jgi:hypothetical protein